MKVSGRRSAAISRTGPGANGSAAVHISPGSGSTTGREPDRSSEKGLSISFLNKPSALIRGEAKIVAFDNSRYKYYKRPKDSTQSDVLMIAGRSRRRSRWLKSLIFTLWNMKKKRIALKRKRIRRFYANRPNGVASSPVSISWIWAVVRAKRPRSSTT